MHRGQEVRIDMQVARLQVRRKHRRHRPRSVVTLSDADPCWQTGAVTIRVAPSRKSGG
jgi:hypothetical protein